MEKRKIVLTILTLLVTVNLFSQKVVRGVVLNAGNRKPVAGAQIINRKNNTGTVTGSDGHFKLAITGNQASLQVQALGYRKKEIVVNPEENSVVTILLSPLSYSLNQITVSAGLVQNERQPVSTTDIPSRTIRNELSDNPLPMVFNNDPSVFTVRNGGGSGDAKLSLRGFEQENVAVLLNGIPINGAENGLMYWSNWLGLTGVIAAVQIQKGPGYANIASNAVGGSINIITDNVAAQKGGCAALQTTSYGNTKVNVSYNSGMRGKKWQWAGAFSGFAGPGYIPTTPMRGFSYFLTAKKVINAKNSLSFTLLGAPQYHEQRTLKLTENEIDRYGFDYNKNWGWYNGKKRNASANFYHKPFFMANHNLEAGKGLKLTNTFYFSYGTGGGKWSESFNYAPSIFEYRDDQGQIDWETIVNNNRNNNDVFVLENGDTVTGFSKNVQTNFLASHVETGLLGTVQYTLTRRLVLTAGIHYRYFRSFLREEISDLLGGRFFIEDYSWSLAGVSGRNQIMYPGDIIKVNNHSVINLINCYARINYANENIQWFLGIKGSNNWYKRIDNYNYTNNPASKTISKPGIDIRTGIGFNTSGNIHSIYVNGAYITKAPYFKYVFGNFTNTPVQNIRNEHFATAEAGYKLMLPGFKLKLSGYYTVWDNVSMLTNEYVQLENNELSRAMINGLKSRHEGIELEITYKFNDFFSFGALASVADYRWMNDVTAKLINNNNVITDTVNVCVKGVHVGGTAQQKAGLYARLRFFKLINLKVEGFYFNNLYASFNPVNRNIEGDYSNSYRFPPYWVINSYLQIPFRVAGYNVMAGINGFNLLDKRYIETGEDGAGHTINTFKGFWSFGRTFNFLVRIYF